MHPGSASSYAVSHKLKACLRLAAGSTWHWRRTTSVSQAQDLPMPGCRFDLALEKANYASLALRDNDTGGGEEAGDAEEEDLYASLSKCVIFRSAML